MSKHPKDQCKCGSLKDARAKTCISCRPSPKGSPKEFVTYRALHYRVEKTRGKASSCSNVQCMGKSNKFHWANLTGNLEDVWDYVPLCASCHRLMDHQLNPQWSLNMSRSAKQRDVLEKRQRDAKGRYRS